MYLDAGALVKRYVAEQGSTLVREVMNEAEGWFTCRVAYVEAVRAVTLAAGSDAADRLIAEWTSFGVLEVDALLTEAAARLAVTDGLRSLDALHLAAALRLPADDLSFVCWDGRLSGAAEAHGLRVIPAP